ncbi:hypothetical protein [Sphingomonas sp. SUN039]|uniref:hypothetical protein n=1 Tax=Sphingomonas sp. SUN039 TaxID=2937787 RepID=UPI00216462E2|nr:hypothetical protein [Sphingomonas sp. SUN039]UVO55528.1 hypothetical protein M0209_15895 [Sphingomonas sp. SUN039]
MTRRAAQLNIRSDAARARVAELVAETGKSATQVVEEALQTYRPLPPVEESLPEGVIRKGRFLVLKADGRRRETIEETIAAINEDRDRDLFYQ